MEALVPDSGRPLRWERRVATPQNCARQRPLPLLGTACRDTGVDSMITTLQSCAQSPFDQNGYGKTLHADPPTHRHTARLCISHLCAPFITAFLKPSRRQCACAECTDNDCQLASHRLKKNTYGLIFAKELHLSACTPNTGRTYVLDFDPPLAGGPHGQEELRAPVSIIMQQLRQVLLLPGFGCHFPDVQPFIIASCFCQFCEAAVVVFCSRVVRCPPLSSVLHLTRRLFGFLYVHCRPYSKITHT